MRIAVVTPRAPSGERGGAEALYDGLVRALRAAGHDADQVDVLVDERTFDGILAAYQACYDLELSAYDAVVSTKAPTFMVRHPNHVSYLLHTIRVFYDMFEREFGAGNRDLLAQRRLVHQLDKHGLHPDRVRGHFANGHTTYRRLQDVDPFWRAIPFRAIHHPPSLEGFRQPRPGDYVFLPGRLHRWKRTDLVIAAFRQVRRDVRLKISGVGEDEPRLRELAGDDPRIELLGQVDEAALLDLYAGALAVPFVPRGEDYGLVTIEAFKSQKPVITCADSGEPVHFVRDFATGFVVEPEPAALARRIEYLADHPDEAAAMGRRGQAAVAHISWEGLVAELLAPLQGAAKPTRGPARTTSHPVTVLDMQPIDPPTGGGRLRLLGLYHGLGERLPTTYLGTFDWPGPGARRLALTPTLTEVDVPLSAEHFRIDERWKGFARSRNVVDVAFPLLAPRSPDFVEAACAAARAADVVVFSHPWVYPLVRDALEPRQLVVYDSHNVEGMLRAEQLEDGGFGTELVKLVAATEEELVRRADLVLACSAADCQSFEQIYGAPAHKLREIPNGVFSSHLVPPDPDQRQAARAALGLDGPAAFFLGSAYGPNVEAVEFICTRLAPALPHVTFLVCGGVAEVLRGTRLQAQAVSNVRFVGLLTEEEKLRYLHAANVALNPMFSGSGTNIKMFDFMAAGLPVVTTPTGARGIEVGSPPAFQVVEATRFAAAVNQVLVDPRLAADLGRRGRDLVERRYSWERLSRDLGRLLEDTLAEKRRRPTGDRPPMPALVAATNGHVANGNGHRARGHEDGLALVTTWGIRCGIAEYARYLVRELEAQGSRPVILASTEEDAAVAPDGWGGAHVERLWRRGTLEGTSLVAACRSAGVRRVSIQRHPGFFPDQALLTAAREAVAAGLDVSVTVHNVELTAPATLRALADAGVALVVHKQEDRDRLAADSVRGVRFVPHGLLELPDQPAGDVRRRLGLPGTPVIGTFGFLRPHKGLLELLEAVSILRDLHPDIMLLAMTALYPTDDSAQYLARCEERIQSLGLADHVRLETGFLPIEEVIRDLQACDAVALAYHPSNEGASGSASVALAARRPLITTRQEIFREMASSLYHVESVEPPVLAAGIATVLSSPALQAALKQRGEQYVHERSWRMVAEQYAGLFPARSLAA